MLAVAGGVVLGILVLRFVSEPVGDRRAGRDARILTALVVFVVAVLVLGHR